MHFTRGDVRLREAAHGRILRLGCSIAVLVGSLAANEGRAQLAITEVMSWASTQCSCCLTQGLRNADFWELTNFGDQPIGLNGYQFVDRDGKYPTAAWPLGNVNIELGESIIFVREGRNISDPAGFRQWWGEANLPPSLQVICCFYPSIGFDERGDSVRLFDPNGNEVDRVDFGESLEGATFDYDPATGAARQSSEGIGGAFRAAACNDIGSPGWATNGPVPLQITQQPSSRTNEPGGDVTFSVRASGLPRPRYQWYFNGNPISRPRGSGVPQLTGFAGYGPAWIAEPPPSDLTISNIQPGDAGRYQVVVFNGLEQIQSESVTLTVNTNPLPLIVDYPAAPPCSLCLTATAIPSLTVSTGQMATLKVMARGFPPPTFQWSKSTNKGISFADIAGATAPAFEISKAQTNDAGLYRVRIQNPGSLTNLFIELVVKPKPQLKITEAMSDQCSSATNPAAADWWELTNVGDEPVNLCGYRWDDAPGNIGAGPTITNAVIVQPGESVIFLEGQTPDAFRNWWGATNLPPNLQFITYTANGLELEGDVVQLWNPTARDDWDDIVRADFSTAKISGASFWFDAFGCFDKGGVRVDAQSAVGQCGAFRAARGCEVGSPGWTRWSLPCLTAVQRVGQQIKLEWRAQPGSANVVQYTSSLTNTSWTDLMIHSSPSATCVVSVGIADHEQQGFYRVKLHSPAACDCPVIEDR